MKNQRKIRVMSVILVLCMTMSAFAATASAGPVYSDVDEDDWFYEAVMFVGDNWSLMNGTGGGKFSPYDDLTRAMLVTILYRWEAEPDMSGVKNPFNDVPNGEWFSDAVIWAAENEIVNGYGDGRFGPDDYVTMEQLMLIIYRWSEDYLPPAIGAGRPYDDLDEVNEWAYDAVFTLNKLGFFFEFPEGNLFRPQSPACRAEVAAVLYRYIILVVAANDGE